MEFTEKHFKLILHDQDRAFCILFLLVLLLAETDLFLKKEYSKKILVKAFGSVDGKVIFILPTKVVAFYIELIAIHVWDAGFQGLV